MVTLGYERVERVESRGEMSVRGGIIDFYPVTSSIAYRIELFDDEIDSIRTFDPADQRSIERIEEITVPPCKELIADRERMEKATDTATLLLGLTVGENDRSSGEAASARRDAPRGRAGASACLFLGDV